MRESFIKQSFNFENSQELKDWSEKVAVLSQGLDENPIPLSQQLFRETVPLKHFFLKCDRRPSTNIFLRAGISCLAGVRLWWWIAVTTATEIKRDENFNFNIFSWNSIFQVQPIWLSPHYVPYSMHTTDDLLSRCISEWLDVIMRRVPIYESCVTDICAKLW
jgi:hypothetical protein